MFSPKPRADQQAFAKGFFPCAKGFASDRFGRKIKAQAATSVLPCPLPSDVSLSSPFRSGPVLRGRPDFSAARGRVVADGGKGERRGGKFLFRAPWNGVISAHKTSFRGSYPCVNPLSLLPFFPSPPCRAACRTPLRAAWPVQSPVRRSLTSPTAMLQPVQSSAVWPAQQAAPCRASADHALTAAASQQHPASFGPFGHSARMAFLFSATAFWPGRDPRGERCLRRS